MPKEAYPGRVTNDQKQAEIYSSDPRACSLLHAPIEIQIRCFDFRVNEFEAEAKGILAVAVVAATMACRFGLSLGRSKVGSKTISNSCNSLNFFASFLKFFNSKSVSIDAL